MALDERYFVASDLESLFRDKDDGLPLANGKLKFFRDNARNVPKEVFQLSGFPPNYTYTSMGSEITLSAVGTVQNSGGDNEVIYYFPFDTDGNLDLYFVRVFDQDNVEQFTREAWPNITSANDPTKRNGSVVNQISNPTFTNVLINPVITTTYTVSSATNQVFNFAPNWDFVISGTGTVIVQQIAIPGDDNVPTSPPYVIDIQIAVGVTACYLKQRFPYNSGLWASTANNPIFLAGSVLARNEGAGTTGLQMFYNESTGGTPITIVDDTFQSSYKILTGVTADSIPASLDTNTGRDGFIDIYLSFIPGSHIRISSIQVIPTNTSTGADFLPYDLDSSNRNEAYQGDYYIPRASAKQIDSYLVGWDFPLNPRQFGLTGNIGTTADYIADQTIAARTVAGNVAVDFNPASDGIRFISAASNCAFYIMQYLSGVEVRKMLGTRLSSNVFGYSFATTGAVTMRIYLYSAPPLTGIPLLPTPLGTIAADGQFTLTAAGWALIDRNGLGTAQTNLNILTSSADINDGKNDYGFSGWEITDVDNNNKFAIVVSFHVPDLGTEVTMNSISVIPGDLPCRPALKTFDETLRECQHYYEKTYSPTTDVGSLTAVGSQILGSLDVFQPGVGNTELYVKSFTLNYKTAKRVAPVLTFYSPAVIGTPDRLFAAIHVPGGAISFGNFIVSNFWVFINENIYSANIFAANAAVLVTLAFDASNEGYYQFHYVADARLGVVT